MALCCSLWSPWTQTWLHVEKGSVFRSFSKHCLLRYQEFPSGGSERLPTARSGKQEHWTFRATFHRNPSVPFALWVHLDLCMIFKHRQFYRSSKGYSATRYECYPVQTNRTHWYGPPAISWKKPLSERRLPYNKCSKIPFPLENSNL